MLAAADKTGKTLFPITLMRDDDEKCIMEWFAKKNRPESDGSESGNALHVGKMPEKVAKWLFVKENKQTNLYGDRRIL